MTVAKENVNGEDEYDTQRRRVPFQCSPVLHLNGSAYTERAMAFATEVCGGSRHATTKSSLFLSLFRLRFTFSVIEKSTTSAA